MMTRKEGNKLLVVIRRPPYGSSLARASLDVALAAAAFDQPVSLLFLGDGVLQLLPNQDSKILGMKSQERALASLPLYDIDKVYVDADAASSYRIDLQAAPVPALPLTTRELQQLLCSHHQLLGF